jgi:hypothetical protein
MENQATPGAPSNAGQTMGIAALVLGIIAAPLAFIPCTAVFAWLPALLAIILGAVGLSQAKKGNGKTGLPIAGLVIGAVSLLIVICWIVLFAEAASEVSDIIQNDSTMMQSLDSAFQQADSVMQAQDSIK